MFITRTSHSLRVLKVLSRHAWVDCVTSSGHFRYFVAPCTRLARLTVLPRGPYLNLYLEPVLPTRAIPVLMPMPMLMGSPVVVSHSSFKAGSVSSMSSAARQAMRACCGCGTGAQHARM